MSDSQKKARATAWEWFGLFASPLAWLLQFIVNYALVRWECIAHRRMAIHIVSACFLLVVITAGIISANILLNTRRRGESGEDVAARPYFMATLGAFSSSLYILAIIMQAIASFIWSPCMR